MSFFRAQDVQLKLLKHRACHLQEVVFNKRCKPTVTTAGGVWPPAALVLSKLNITRTQASLSDVGFSQFPKNPSYISEAQALNHLLPLCLKIATRFSIGIQPGYYCQSLVVHTAKRFNVLKIPLCGTMSVYLCS